MDIACSIHVFFKYVFIISTPHAHYILCVCLMIALWANRNIIIIIISSSSSSIVIINYYYTAIQWISLETSQNQVRLISEAPPRLHPTQASNPGLAMPGPPELGQVTPTWRSTNPPPWELSRGIKWFQTRISLDGHGMSRIWVRSSKCYRKKPLLVCLICTSTESCTNTATASNQKGHQRNRQQWSNKRKKGDTLPEMMGMQSMDLASHLLQLLF
jgi:hypothetical protein